MDVLHLPLAHGKRYVLIIVDLFTHWPEAFALTQVTSALICICLVKVISNQGFIQRLICDNASYNVSEEVKAFCKSINIILSPVSDYHPEANGIANSKVGALKTLLKTISQ